MKEELLLFLKMESVPIFLLLFFRVLKMESLFLPLLFLKMESLFLVTKMESVPIFLRQDIQGWERRSLNW